MFEGLINPLDWGYLTQVPRGLMAYGPLALAFLAVYLIGLIANLTLGRWLARRWRDHALHRRLARRAGQIINWLLGIGLTFFIFRALELPLLGIRLWLYLSLLSLVVAGCLALGYRLLVYPDERARYDYEQERQRYLRPVSGGRGRRREASRH